MTYTWVNPSWISIREKLPDSADMQVSIETAFHNELPINRTRISDDPNVKRMKKKSCPVHLAKGIALLLFLVITMFGYQVHEVHAAPRSADVEPDRAASLEENDLQGSICGTQTDLPLTECEALVALFTQTNGSSWINHTGWLATNTPCSWYGVTCTSGHVTQLSLNSNGLNGSIPTELGNLAYLLRLSLTGNHLSGTIPTSLGSLANLQYLFLSNNQLTGSIPAELGNLANLQYLSLPTNQLSGAIPAGLGNLSNLISMSLSTNQLSASIPAELGNLDRLQSLSLSSNQLSGSIPASLGGMASLRTLQLTSNRLSGSIPAELGIITTLRTLELSNNQLSGSIPPELGNLTNMTRLLLGGNQLSGTIPASLGSLANLQTLNLEMNQLTGNIPPELGNLDNLTSLSLSSNQLSGSIPAELGGMARLQNLHLYANGLTGSIPAELGNITTLRVVELFNNQLSGTIPPQLGNLTNATNLLFGHNRLSGSAPSELGNLVNLQHLSLADNQLSGPIPLSYINLTHLAIFRFYTNPLCEPTSAEFLAWKGTVSTWMGTSSCYGKVSPTNGQAVQSINLDLSWEPMTPVTSYEYCFDTSDDNSCTGWINNGLNTTASLSNLSINTTYYWHVRARNSENITIDSDDGTWWSFSTTSQPPPAVFGKSSPEANAIDQPLNLSLAWSASDPGDTYEYCISTTGPACASEEEWVAATGTSAALAGLSYNTSYYWQVRARNSENITIESDDGTWWSFTTTSQPPSGFGKTSPLNDATNQPLSLTLAWSSAGTGFTYEYCVTQAIPLDCGANWLSVAATSVEITGLANSTTYYWQVRGLDGGGSLIDANSQDANPIWQFSTRPAPPSSSDVTYNDINEDQSLADDLPGANLMTFALTGVMPAGTLTLSPDGHFTYQPPLNFYGQVQFQFTVTDGINDPVGPYTVTVNYVPVNDPPVAVVDSYPIASGTVLSVNAPGVLGNDSDIDSLALTAGLISGPVNGILTLNPDGSFQYQPNPGYSGTDTFSYQTSDGQVGSNTVLVTLTVSSTDRIFADGFESGTLGGWTANVNDGGDLSAAANAAMVGSYGMQAVIDDNNAIYVTDDSPNAEKRYRARFYFDPNSLAMGITDRHQIFAGYSGTSTVAFVIDIRRSPAGVFTIRVGTFTDAGVPVATPWTAIADDRQSIEIDWQASSGVGANNGSLSWWINGIPQAGSSGIDNDTRQIDRVRLGAVNGVNSATRGAYFFDDFISERVNYIGPAW